MAIAKERQAASIPAEVVNEPETPIFPQTESIEVLDLYLEDISRFPLLTPEEEVSLAGKIADGRKAQEALSQNGNSTGEEKENLERLVRAGEKAKVNFTKANLRLVVNIAKRYVGRGVPFPDLFQEGNIGLMKAVEKFNPDKKNPETGEPNKFSTYATWWIRQAVTRAVAGQGRTIRLPLHVNEKIRSLNQARRQLEQGLRREPTLEELAKQLGISFKEVCQLLMISQTTLSLNTPIGDRDIREGETFGYFIGDKKTPDPSEVAANEQLKEGIKNVLKILTAPQERVLWLRFGLGDGRKRTLQEVAEELGCSRENVRQREKKGLERLRSYLSKNPKGLKDSLEWLA